MNQETYADRSSDVLIEETIAREGEVPEKFHRAVRNAGVLFFMAGAISLMGIISGEIFYPRNLGYNVYDNDISDLGGTLPPEGLVVQPSATIFDWSMILAGLLILGGAYLLYRGSERMLLSAMLVLMGIGVLGVGLFPGNIVFWHPIFAMLTFLAGAIAAIISAGEAKTLIRVLFALLGLISLVFLLFSGSFIPTFGVGGTERWIVYPILIWILGFGGYLSGRNARTLG